MDGLAGKRALVTGASYGIGRAVAVRLAREGAHVAINHRDSADQAEAITVPATVCGAIEKAEDVF